MSAKNVRWRLSVKCVSITSHLIKVPNFNRRIHHTQEMLFEERTDGVSHTTWPAYIRYRRPRMSLLPKACSLHVPFQMTELLQHWQLSVRGPCLNISFPANPYSKRQREMSVILNFRVRFPLFVQRCLSLVMQRNDDRNAVRFFASRRLLARPIASTPSSFQNTGTEQALQYFLQPRQLVHCEAIGFPIWL